MVGGCDTFPDQCSEHSSARYTLYYIYVAAKEEGISTAESTRRRNSVKNVIYCLATKLPRK